MFTETRVVRFNLNNFSKDYVFCHENGMNRALITLEEGFKKFISSSPKSVVDSSRVFLSKSEFVKSHEILKSFIDKELEDFSN